MNVSTKIFLVLLQLAIGWHFLYEGLWKMQGTNKWTSKGYLSASNGPVAPALRWSAGDPTVTRDGVNFKVDNPIVEVAALYEFKPIDRNLAPIDRRLHLNMPAPLDQEWNAYYEAFLKAYQLDQAPAPTEAEIANVPPEFIAVLGADPMASSIAIIPWGAVQISWVPQAWLYDNTVPPDTRVQRLLAERRLRQLKAETVTWMSEGTKKVKRPYMTGPAAETTVSIPQRVQEFLAADQRARDLAASKGAMFGDKATPELKKARDDAAALRTELLGEIKDRTTQMKLALHEILTPAQKRMAGDRYKLTDAALAALARTEITTGPGQRGLFPKTDVAKLEALKDREFASRAEFLGAAVGNLGWDREDVNLGPVLAAAKFSPLTPPAESRDWARIKLVDSSVRWGLVLIGGCLILGLFSRLACVAGAVFLLSFYFAMPAFPWLPEAPMSEGHYLYVNKNIIEMLALVAIACSYPGSRYGLDLLVGPLFRRAWGAIHKPTDEGKKGDESRVIAVTVPAEVPDPHNRLTGEPTAPRDIHAS